MDEVDYKILEILRENARMTNGELAKKVELTEGAVRNRIKRLVSGGVIKRFTIDTESGEIEAIVLMKTRTKGSREILKRIRKYANRMFETAGEYDTAAFLTAESIEQINKTVDDLRGIEGVITTVTLLKIAGQPVDEDGQRVTRSRPPSR